MLYYQLYFDFIYKKYSLGTKGSEMIDIIYEYSVPVTVVFVESSSNENTDGHNAKKASKGCSNVNY